MPATSDTSVKHVNAVRWATCISGTGEHPSMLRLDDGIVSASDAMALIEAGQKFAMTPPPGAPAYDAHKATGLDLLLQTRVCDRCQTRVLFA